MYKYSRVRKGGGVVVSGGETDQLRWGLVGDKYFFFFFFQFSLGDIVHPIDYSGGAVLVRLSRRHLFP